MPKGRQKAAQDTELNTPQAPTCSHFIWKAGHCLQQGSSGTARTAQERSSVPARVTDSAKTCSRESDLVRPQDCKLQKGFVLSEGGKASTPWIFQDGPDHHHLGLF